jgi:TolA-binding protein
MPSTLTRQQSGPYDAVAIEPGAGVARTNQASPDPVHEVLSLLSRRRAQAAPGVSAIAPTPTVDTTFRAAAADTIRLPGDRPAMSRWVKKTSVAFLFALCAVAAAAWKQQGGAAREMISNWVPPSVLTSFAPTETPPPAPVQAAAADQAPAQPTPAAGAAADSAQLLPSMARDLAAMGQQIEQLKASIEQLRDSQAQMSRDIAKNSETKTSEAKTAEIKTSEPNVRPRVAALPPRPVAAPPRKPRPAFPQAAATSTLPPPPYPPLPPPAQSQPAPPPQSAAEPDGEPVVRPPMPLH